MAHQVVGNKDCERSSGAENELEGCGREGLGVNRRVGQQSRAEDGLSNAPTIFISNFTSTTSALTLMFVCMSWLLAIIDLSGRLEVMLDTHIWKAAVPSYQEHRIGCILASRL